MTMMTSLDVRPVEPKDRFERIMDHYERLDPHETLELTVDHDPECMYYTLLATRGPDAFTFDYVEGGPETWRVRVTKLRHVTADYGA
jgi:uncharacterized protein (DUF2249 family)